MSAGKKFIKSLIWLLPALLLIIIINPLFVHKGVTVLTRFKSGNVLTAESIFFGVAVALSMASAIFIFYGFNKVMTSDRIICLTGRISPSFSLVLSMSLGFVPRFKERFRDVCEARRGIDSGKMKSAAKTLSAMLTWSLESGVVTADSMRARGFGCAKRTSYSIFKFTSKDLLVMLIMCTELTFFIIFLGKYTYFPSLTFKFSSISFIPYCMFLSTPLILGEEKRQI